MDRAALRQYEWGERYRTWSKQEERKKKEEDEGTRRSKRDGMERSGEEDDDGRKVKSSRKSLNSQTQTSLQLACHLTAPLGLNRSMLETVAEAERGERDRQASGG